tara:strand:+ start:64 stop:366 length:303 start_codon:yes stop_codon:yes gene_type:complete
MTKLKGYQRKFLRSNAHHIKPTVFVGKNDLTSGVFNSINDAFSTNELIKIKIPSKDVSPSMIEKISMQNECHIVGSIGRVLIAYKMNKDPELRKIKLPNK